MKKLLAVMLSFSMLHATSHTKFASIFDTYKTSKDLNCITAALCATVSVVDLYRARRIISAGIRYPLLLHAVLGQAGLAFAANALSLSVLKQATEQRNLDPNFLLNTFQATFN